MIDMPGIGAKYQTIISLYTPTVPGIQLILGANARRVYVKFCQNGGAGNHQILPGTGFFPTAPIPPQELIVEYKWKDCPSVVSGEWYWDGVLLFSVTILECVYLGEG